MEALDRVSKSSPLCSFGLGKAILFVKVEVLLTVPIPEHGIWPKKKERRMQSTMLYSLPSAWVGFGWIGLDWICSCLVLLLAKLCVPQLCDPFGTWYALTNPVGGLPLVSFTCSLHLLGFRWCA